MKRILLLCVFLTWALPARASHALVQSATSTECTGTTTCTIALTGTTSGNTVIIVYKFSNNATFTSVTNNNSNANTRCGSEFDASGAVAARTGIYYSSAINSGSVTYTLTINTAPSDDIRLLIDERGRTQNSELRTRPLRSG